MSLAPPPFPMAEMTANPIEIIEKYLLILYSSFMSSLLLVTAWTPTYLKKIKDSKGYQSGVHSYD
jgi:hypothetical protein